MRCVRKTDDFVNHATSGALCAGLLVRISFPSLCANLSTVVKKQVEKY
jgi:hypothetical protein